MVKLYSDFWVNARMNKVAHWMLHCRSKAQTEVLTPGLEFAFHHGCQGNRHLSVQCIAARSYQVGRAPGKRLSIKDEIPVLQQNRGKWKECVKDLSSKEGLTRLVFQEGPKTESSSDEDETKAGFNCRQNRRQPLGQCDHVRGLLEPAHLVLHSPANPRRLQRIYWYALGCYIHLWKILPWTENRTLALLTWRERGFPGSSDGKASAYNEGDLGSIPGLGRSPGEGNGNPLQYSCLENPMDRGAWWATTCGVTKSQTWLSDFTSLHLEIEMDPFRKYKWYKSFYLHVSSAGTP